MRHTGKQTPENQLVPTARIPRAQNLLQFADIFFQYLEFFARPNHVSRARADPAASGHFDGISTAKCDWKFDIWKGVGCYLLLQAYSCYRNASSSN